MRSTQATNYAHHNPDCELAFYVGVRFRNGKLERDRVGIQVPAADVNHIWSVGRRPDLWSNFISLTRPAHEWFHAHIGLGRILCVLAKLRKRFETDEPTEFDLQEMNMAAGKYVLGMIENTPIPNEFMWSTWKAECVNGLYRLMEESAR